MNLKIAVVGMIFCVALGNVVAKDVTTSELRKLLTSRIEAFSKNDTVELKNICTKDYQFINSTGSKFNREEMKKIIANQKQQIKSYVIQTFQPFVAENESMAFVVSEIDEEILQDKTIVKNSLIVTEIYRKENKDWKIQLTQISQKICHVQ
jgi:Zn-dependent M16 (insulinase) family peptidase